jgi:hypothetical protein
MNLKTSIVSVDEKIIIILLIPTFSNKSFSKLKIEPIPNKENKCLDTFVNEIIIDNNNKVYYFDLNQNHVKNLKEIKDNCLNKIFTDSEANCKFKTFKDSNIKEISNGLIITKKFS